MTLKSKNYCPTLKERLMSKTCSACQGSGHDKAGRPVVKLEKTEIQKFDESGQVIVVQGQKHITLAQGSGCINCRGIGRV